MREILLSSAFLFLPLGAQAQTKSVTVRGKIESIDSQTIVVNDAGLRSTFQIGPSSRFESLGKTLITDVKPGASIRVNGKTHDLRKDLHGWQICVYPRGVQPRGTMGGLLHKAGDKLVPGKHYELNCVLKSNAPVEVVATANNLTQFVGKSIVLDRADAVTDGLLGMEWSQGEVRVALGHNLGPLGKEALDLIGRDSLIHVIVDERTSVVKEALIMRTDALPAAFGAKRR